MSDNYAANTDRELYREGGGDGNGQSYYEPSIHVTAGGAIGMNVGGHVITTSIRGWHALATERDANRAAIAKVAEVRDFAAVLAIYEADHAAGPETPALLAMVHDLLAIVGCPTCTTGQSRETVGMVCRTCGTDYSGIEAKVERSSFGTPEAKAARASVSDEQAAAVVAMADRFSKYDNHREMSAAIDRCEVVDEYGMGRCLLDAHDGPSHAFENVPGPPGPPQRWQVARKAD